MNYRYIENVAREVSVPPDGILSRTLHNDERIKVVLFGFDAGQELSEHTARTAAILEVLSGEATIRLGADTVQARAGAWIHMAPELPHSVAANTPTVLLLTLLKGA